MPWIPELFSNAALARIWEDERRRRLELVPFFAGVTTGETAALVDSFVGEPELHHPVRGRIKGVAAFERYVADTRAWLADRHATAEDVDFVLTTGCGVEELVLHLDGGVALPVAVATDHEDDGRIIEQRMYFSGWALNGRHAIRPPLLQPADGLRAPGIVGDYQRALAAGDAEGIVAAYEPDGYMREPAGGAFVHRGTDELRAAYGSAFSNGGGIGLELCAVTADGAGCALEYNAVAWGRTPLAPQAGIAVYVRGANGNLAAARIYDDVEPPIAKSPVRP